MKKVLRGALFGLISFFIISFLSANLFIFRDFERAFLGFCFIWTKEERKSYIEDIVIIDIDNDSLRVLGRWQDWPRRYYKEVIDYVKQGEPKAIAFDIFFPEYSNPNDDTLLIEATKGGNVIYSFFFPYTSEIKEEPNLEFMKKFSFSLPKRGIFLENRAITPPIIEIQKAAKAIGYGNRYPDDDGETRLIPLVGKYKDRIYLSFSLATVCSVLGVLPNEIKLKDNYLLLSNKKKIPVDVGARMWIKYLGKEREVFRYVSFYNVLKKRVPEELFKDKIAIIGGSAEGLFDIMSTPFSPVCPGVETHATIIYNILNNNFLIPVERKANIFCALLLSIIIGIFSSIFSLRVNILIVASFLFGYLIISITSFKNGLIIPVVTPSFSMMGTFLSVWLYRFQIEEREKRRIRGIFSRYVNKDVVEELIANPTRLSLGGKRQELSFLFSDIIGFTTISETLSPEELVSLLNEYFEAMNEIIFKHNGTLDKYIGDAIMVIYGAPIFSPYHAKDAILTSFEMIRELERLKKLWKSQGKKQFDIGIGINTGEAVVGNIGSEIQTNYTVIGDEVNLASRLEGMTRIYNTQIVISTSTYEKIKDEVIAREIDTIIVKGKTRPVKIYEPIGLINELDDKKKRELEIFSKGLLLYKEKRFQEAADTFSKIMHDGIGRMYFMRCQDYIVNPPPLDWDGVYVYRTK